MKLDELIKTNARGKKRLGRGLGSGKGKTGGRGTKGQKARGRVSIGFIGGTLPLYRRLPYRRGYGNQASKSKTLGISLSKLAVFAAGSEVNLQNLIEQKLITETHARKFGVKILGDGEIAVALTVKVPTSVSAAAKIEKAGGKIVSA